MRHAAPRKPRSTKTARKNSTKLVASAALVVAAAGVAGLGTFGSFTSATSASQSVASGTVKIDLANQAGRGLDIAATNLVPGDYAQRAVTLTRASDSEAFGSVKLTTVAALNNDLATGGNGLKLKIDSCPTAWVKAATSNDLLCAGSSTGTQVLASGSVIRTDADLGSTLTALNGTGRIAHLRLELSLPEAADNTYQGLNNSINVTFNATQRTAQAR